MIVISILAIVSSLVIGFSLLFRLEGKKIRNLSHSPYAVAKENALLAAYEAIAKLQVATGNDRTTTAKADIFDHFAEGKKHWVGAWEVQKCDEKNVSGTDTKKFLAWLVSGDYYGESDSQMAFPFEKDYVPIIDAKYKNVESVYVPLIDRINSDGKRGQYAYWIDDQSLKVQCNLYDPENRFKDLFSEEIKTVDGYFYLRRQFQGRYGIEMTEESAYSPLSQNFLKDNLQISADPDYEHLIDYSIFSEQQSQYLQRKYHDFTALSLGLITDTRRGGFRKNLSGNDSETYLDEIPDEAFIFTAPTTYPAPPPTWGYYKSFYNLRRETASGSIGPRATYPLYRPQSGVNYGDCEMHCTADENGYEKGKISGTNAGDLGMATTCGIYPIWTEFKTHICLCYCDKYSPMNDRNNDNRFYQSLKMQPGFHFENPYAYDLSSLAARVWHCAPYVENPESGDRLRYQKQPSFRCKFCDGDGITIRDGLLQGYLQSQNDGDKIFPFLSKSADQCMRPVWDCTLGATFPKDRARYFGLSGDTSYISLPNPRPLQVVSSANLSSYCANDIRFYQPDQPANALDPSPTYGTTSSLKCLLESYPSGDPWPNASDQWSPLCLRTMDGDGKILQQICDVEVRHEKINMSAAGGDRNTTANDLSNNYGKNLPLYLICAGLRKNSSQSSDYWHQYTPTNLGIRPFVEGNPRAPFSCRNARQDDLASPSYASHFIPGNWSWNAHWLGLGDGNAVNYFSQERENHVSFGDYSAFRNLFDLPHPTHGIMNLGFLQHMNVGCFSYHPSYAFGNSYQNPWIPREKFFQENAPIEGSPWPSHSRVEMLYDYSYCLNRALWDAYFYASYDANLKILLNPHQKAFTAATAGEFSSFSDAAKGIVIGGAFNINGTSLEAWSAFLGSAIGAITGSDEAEFSRIQSLEFSRIQSLESATDVGWRKLNKMQIRALAEKIVEQIKKRGVAGSIGEFVNRKLVAKSSDPDQLGLKGALQAAIDGTAINDGYGGDGVESKRNKAWFDDGAASGPFWAGKPGYLTQADILQSTATSLCARGDTFCIHAYGNACDRDGKIEAEARCEVLVQRMPKLLDPAKPELGRKYQILAVKWVTT
jgi:hypothetical protein